MDETADGIIFGADGRCNFCTGFAKKYHEFQLKNFPQKQAELIAEIKNAGKNREYDCIIGVSGGVDSSYCLYLAKQAGLRPLAVHLDNGWNSELAVHNISNLIQNLGVDLHTHVIDWQENRDMQLAFFKANVVDIELLMDNAMMKLNYNMANKHGVKYILAGTNTATEGMAMPKNWNWFKFDKYNIRQIHKEFGKLPIKTHPLISTNDFIYFEFIKKIKWLHFLNYFPYNKQQALNILSEKVGYRPYPYKHYESIFTRFYQAYILPQKFNIDKRKIHLSTLIVSGQMSRDDAVIMLAQPTYPHSHQLESDKEFVQKKLGFTNDTMNQYIHQSAIAHDFYGSEKPYYMALMNIYKWLQR